MPTLSLHDIATVGEKMASNGQSLEGKPGSKLKWYQKLWKKELAWSPTPCAVLLNACDPMAGLGENV